MILLYLGGGVICSASASYSLLSLDVSQVVGVVFSDLVLCCKLVSGVTISMVSTVALVTMVGVG